MNSLLKNFLIFLFLLSFGQALRAIPVQTFLDSYYYKEVTKKIAFELNQEFQFRNAFEKLYLYYFEPLGLYTINDTFRLGLQSRIYAVDFSLLGRGWDTAIEPGLVMREKFKLFGIPCFARQKALYRIFMHEPNQRYLRFQFGAALLKKGRFVFFALNETYYNFFNHSSFDLNNVAAYISATLGKGFFFDLYCAYYVFQDRRAAPWRDSLVFGMALTYGRDQYTVGFR